LVVKTSRERLLSTFSHSGAEVKMKAALSLTLVAALITSALPVTAQERIDRTAGPIRRAITLEAVRLATEPAVVDAAQPAGVATNADWSRVRKLTPGTEITVTASGSQPGKRDVLSADESGLTVLNLDYPTLPADASKVLRDVASHNPAHFTDAQKGGTFLLDKHVRLESDGVFVADQKVADLGQIVERTRRTEVVEIRRESARRHPAAWGALVGAAAGVAAVAVASSGSLCGSDGCIGGVLMALFGAIGAGAGAGIGAAIGASHPKTEETIYRAP
jgi:hypothetical protein